MTRIGCESLLKCLNDLKKQLTYFQGEEYVSITVFHTKTLENTFLDTLVISSELHDPMHICIYHHDGLSFGS